MRPEAENWWKQAENDFESAEDNFAKTRRYYLVVFLCQQAVEKGLKACFMHLKNTSPGSTHSLIDMAAKVEAPQKFFMFLRMLMPQFVNTRYPDAACGVPSDLYDEEIASEYLKKTKEVMEWLDSKMRK